MPRESLIAQQKMNAYPETTFGGGTIGYVMTEESMRVAVFDKM